MEEEITHHLVEEGKRVRNIRLARLSSPFSVERREKKKKKRSCRRKKSFRGKGKLALI